MPKVTRRLGVDRAAEAAVPDAHLPPTHLQGVRAPEKIPEANLEVTLEDIVAQQEASSAAPPCQWRQWLSLQLILHSK